MSNPDNTLDDLILTDPEPEKGKSKSLLLLLALVIVLIIVGAILAKMIFGGSDDTADKSVKNKTELSADTMDSKKDLLNDTKDNNNDLAPIAGDPDLAPVTDDNKNVPSNVDTINIDEAKKSTNSLKDNKKDITEDNTANSLGVAPVGASKSNAKDNMDLETDNATLNEQEKPKHTKAKVIHNKPNAKVTKHTYGGVGNVYIQVGSFTKGPEQSFIRKIRRAGFKYRIKTSNGYRRVYVGPFRSRSEANNVLGIVKSKIAPNAFVK